MSIATRFSIVLGDEEYEVFGELRENCYNDGNIIGTFMAKEFEFEIEQALNLKEKEFKVYHLINNTRMLKGTFTTIDISINDTTRVSKIFALDYEIKTQIPYVSELDYESGDVTLFDVWEECCSLADLENGMTTIQNGDFVVDSDQFTNTKATVQMVMREIAKCTMDFVTIGADDKVYLKLKNETDYVIENYEELEDKRDTHKITTLIYGQADIKGQEGIAADGELVEEYGNNKIVINDNLFAYTNEKRQFFADTNYDKIKLFGYSSFVAKNTFMPNLNLGDLIKFKTLAGEETESIVLKKSTKILYDDVEFIIEAPSITKSTVDYKKPESVNTILKRTEIVVDRYANTIIALAKNVETLDKKVDTFETGITNNTDNIADIFADNKFTPDEKTSASNEFDVITDEYIKNKLEAEKYEIDTADYTTAYTNLQAYLQPLFLNMNYTDDIVAENFKTNFNNFYAANVDLINAINNYTQSVIGVIEENVADLNINQDSIETNVGKITTDLVNNYYNKDEVDGTTNANKEEIGIVKSQNTELRQEFDNFKFTITEKVEADVEEIKNDFVTINNEGIFLDDNYSAYSSSFGKQNAKFNYNNNEVGRIGLLDDKGNYGVRFPKVDTDSIAIGQSTIQDFTQDSEIRTGVFI